MLKPTVYALGDVHGKMARLLEILEQLQPHIVLQTGDLGLSPNPSADTHSVHYLEKRLCALPVAPTFYWCDGNHEYWHELTRLLMDASPEERQHGIQLTEHIFWMPRGSWQTLPDGRLVLFAGGAKSVDWELRLQHGLPWAGLQEQLRSEDLDTPYPPPDIVVSHTAPYSMRLPGIDDLSAADRLQMTRQKGWDLSPDNSRNILESLYIRYNPSRWLCGHFHCFADIHTHTTHFTALDCLTGTGQQWVEL